ncbi:hypothetical protein PPERSA_02535 [Pseudocohnilembus persalinus]|uniref:Cell division cycle protein 123 n=1 Tax=Pseudocohnilembus persalinus TaxID=266149 RepID=A0A0V0R599_PSEPJ|nr:hypothetical protein PPERSA_02535 [Pseudocohnilembus persalinus]|eukprot:KRX09663.1 hypothetical protein PPERSA_02535 [Pseudocohnilembus persalinus]
MEETKLDKQKVQYNNIFDFLQINWPKSIRKLAFKHRFVELDQNFLDYIKEDGIFIHQDYCRDKEIFKDMEEEDLQNFHKFSEKIEQQINQVIQEFGQVYYKINWKAALDCQNFAQNLKITHIEDLIKLLKSSQIQTEMILDYQDLFQFNLNNENNQNVKENPIDTSQNQNSEKEQIIKIQDYKKEFRCFVYKKELRAICQKNTGDFYKEMKDIVQEIKPKIVNFFQKNIQNQFEASENYVFDIYIENMEKPKIWIIDIDPWQEFTNPLLFSFEEIVEFSEKNQNDSEQIMLKYVDEINKTQIRDYSAYRVPEELADDNPTQENLIKLMEEMAKQDPKFFQ